MPERRRLILCADDFALDDAVSEGVLRLVEAGRISAVSCFADSPAWRRAGAALRDRLERGRRASMGLHFNLTQDFGFGERPLGYWIGASLVRAVDRARVRRHLLRQLEAFRAVAEAWPDFIDGHQHVHAFPVVRDVVAAVAAEVRPEAPVPLRDVREFFGPTDAPLKRIIIRSLARAGAGRAPGGRAHRQRAAPPAAAARPGGTRPGGTSSAVARPAPDPAYLNDAMAGDYSLAARADFAGLVAGWLAAAPARGLVMCHPAVGPANAGQGPRELAFLESAAFGELLARHGIELAPA